MNSAAYPRPWRPHTLPHAPARLGRASLSLLVCGALLLTSSACTLRLGHGAPATLPSQTQAQSTRDALARQALLIGSTAQVVSTADATPAIQALAKQIYADTTEQNQALGGVWQPWSSPQPTELPTVAPIASAAPDASVADLAQTLVQGVTSARKASVSATDADAAQLYASLTVAWALAYQDLNAQTQINSDTEGISAGSARQSSKMTAALGADLVETYDAARYALEEVAARASDETRTRAQDQANYAGSVVDAALALGSTDSRLAAYAPPSQAADAADSVDTIWARQVWTQIAQQEIVYTADVDGQARTEAIDAAIWAAAQAVAWGASFDALPAYNLANAN